MKLLSILAALVLIAAVRKLVANLVKRNIVPVYEISGEGLVTREAISTARCGRLLIW